MGSEPHKTPPNISTQIAQNNHTDHITRNHHQTAWTLSQVLSIVESKGTKMAASADNDECEAERVGWRGKNGAAVGIRELVSQ